MDFFCVICTNRSGKQADGSVLSICNGLQTGKGMAKERVSAARSARRFCLWCQGDGRTRVADCCDEGCPLHPVRMGSGEDERVVARAIRAYCLQCAGDEDAVRECPAGKAYRLHAACPLYSYRFGRLPRAKKKKKAPVKSGARSVRGRLPGLGIAGSGNGES